MNINFIQLFLYFIIYSMAGWVCESIWCSIGGGRPVNRGFLYGPWCPVYGFGALIILACTNTLPRNPAIVFFVSMISTSALEYFTGWMLETLFQTRWWDYSQRRFNLRGRVCLRNSLLFGLMGIAVALYIHPAVERLVAVLGVRGQRLVSAVLMAVLAIDLGMTLYAITGLKKRLNELKAILRELEVYQREYTWYDMADPAGSIARLRDICKHTEGDEKAEFILERIDRLESRRNSGTRMLKAFPKMQPKELVLEVETLRKEWQAKRDMRKQERKNRKKKSK